MSVRIAEWCIESNAGGVSSVGVLLRVSRVQWFERMPPGQIGIRVVSIGGVAIPFLVIKFEGYGNTFILFLRERGLKLDPIQYLTADSVTFYLAELEDTEPVAAFDSPVEAGFWSRCRSAVNELPKSTFSEFDRAVYEFLRGGVDPDLLWNQPENHDVVAISSEEDLLKHEKRLREAGAGDLVDALLNAAKKRRLDERLRRMYRQE